MLCQVESQAAICPRVWLLPILVTASETADDALVDTCGKPHASTTPFEKENDDASHFTHAEIEKADDPLGSDVNGTAVKKDPKDE
jgi:hypothetical protein